MKNFRNFILSAVSGLIIMLLCSCGNDDPVKIGVIMSLSGEGSHMRGAVNGIMLAAEEVNERGGIGGNQIELIIRDNETNPLKAAEIFNELENEYCPDLYICGLSTIAAALAPLADQNRAPLICLATTNSEISAARPWVFRFSVSAEQEIPPVNYFIENLGLNEISVLYRDDEFGTFIFDHFKRSVVPEDLSVRSFPYLDAASDTDGYMSELKNSGAVYMISFSTDLEKIIPLLRNRGYQGHLLACSSLTRNLVESTPEAEGLYCAAPAIFDQNFAFAQSLKNKFEARFGDSPDHFIASGYESIVILSTLMDEQEINRQTIQESFSGGFNHNGSLGKIIVKKGSSDFNFPLFPAEIVNGEFHYE